MRKFELTINPGNDAMQTPEDVFGLYSVTTLRHIKEFLKQNGFKAETKAQIAKDYM